MLITICLINITYHMLNMWSQACVKWQTGEPAPPSQGPEWEGTRGHIGWGAAGCAAHAAVWCSVWRLCRSCCVPHGSYQAPHASPGSFSQLCRSALQLLACNKSYRTFFVQSVLLLCRCICFLVHCCVDLPPGLILFFTRQSVKTC